MDKNKSKNSKKNSSSSNKKKKDVKTLNDKKENSLNKISEKNNDVKEENKFNEFTYVPIKEDKNANYALKMINIHKSFNNGAIKANVGMNLYVKKNTIHSIIGENGAGKSTLMSILFGMYEQDIGDIYINNEKVKFKSSKDANKYKIGMVHQHFKLVDNFTVFENIILGCETTINGFIKKSESRKILIHLIKKYNFNIDIDSKISELTVGQQQKVEILKILYRESEIMIFDEPTAVLSDHEIKSFLDILLKFKENGKTIIIITHKLHEIKTVADEATIIRKGKYIDSINVKTTSIEKMAELMVGKKIVPSINNLNVEQGDVVLEVNGLNLNYISTIEKKITEFESTFKTMTNKLSRKSKTWFKKLFNKNQNDTYQNDSNYKIKKSNDETTFDSKNQPTVSFKIHAGEIYAIAGVEGNGQSNLIKQIAGINKCNPNSIKFLNQDVSNLSIQKRIDLGISHVPEDRHKYGLDLNQNVRLNIVNNQINKKPFSNLNFLVDYEIVNYSQTIIDKYDVRGSANGVAQIGSLSGGNQQKAIIGRELEKKHKLIILAQPTRGLDVGAIQYIHSQIIEEKKKGNAILLVSYELDEILALADTIAVISRNKIIEENNRKVMTREHIGQLLAGESL